MSEDEPGVDDVLDRGFARYGDPSHEQIAADLARIRERLDPAVTRMPLALAPDSSRLVASAFRRKSIQLAAASVLVAAALVAAKLVWRMAGEPLYRIVEGDVRGGDPPSLLRSFGETSVIRSNGGGGGVLALTDGSRIEMRAHSALTLERADDGIRIRLNEGGIIVNAAKQRTGHLYVQTKDMTVSVVGTVFVVNADEKGSRVTVLEGEVRVRQGANETKLRPGERVATSPNAQGFTLASELAWSRRAKALLAMLPADQQPPTAPAASKDPRLAFEAISIRPHASGPGTGRTGGVPITGMSPFAPGCAGDAEVDPRRFTKIGTTIWDLITVAYTGNPWGCRDVTQMNVISGGPAWLKTERWDVIAGIPAGVLSAAELPRAGHWRNEKPSKLQKMIERLLAERVGLVVRREIKEVPAYVLKMVGAAPRFTPPWDRASPSPPRDERMAENWKQVWENSPSGQLRGEPGAAAGKDVSMTGLVELLAGLVGRPVADETGFSSPFNLSMMFRPLPGTPFSTNGRLAASGFPDIFTALEQQVGLRLEETTAKTEFWVIERIERPTEN